MPPQGGRKHPQQEYIQIDTKDILFICGGAFVGLEEIIKRRTGKRVVGFGADVTTKDNVGNVLRLVEPEDLIKYGMIPEFVGRLPVVATLDELNEDQLVKILVEPKNALTKQYERLLALDNVKLRFTEGALRAIARRAIERKTGARGLRAILEEIMLEIMYEVPSKKNVRECIINEEVVTRKERPILIYEKTVESA